jgi:carbon-monoxide dehydrogenase medium subunit
MRMASDSKKSYFLPKSLNELDELALSQKEELTFVAGTTDLMVQEKAWQQANNLVDLTSLPELSKTLQVQDKGVLIGAALPISDLISNPIVREKFPILVDVCRQIGSVQIQNRATLGGNIANASPAGDSLPVLAVLDAEIWIGPRARGGCRGHGRRAAPPSRPPPAMQGGMPATGAHAPRAG